MSNETSNTRITNELLKEISALELNDRLISLPIFTCAICKNLLNPPIMLMTSTGNICGTCFDITNDNNAVRNFALEIILQNLGIPCKNARRGCKEKLDYSNMLKHLKTCNNRNYSCPLKLLNMCMWEGNSTTLIEHSKEHPDFLIVENDNQFKVNIDTSSSKDLLKLLYNNVNKFILHIKCDLDALKLYFKMYRVGNNDMSELSYQIESISCSGIKNYSLRCDSNNVIFKESEFINICDFAQAIEVDLGLIKKLFQAPLVTITIKILNQEFETLDGKLLSYFECPVCNHFMKPPIYQCLAGHSICLSCRPKLERCPTCRSGFGNTRNYTLELLGGDIRFPCKYHDLGCQTILLFNEIEQHEPLCTLKPYKCPFSEFVNCEWEGINLAIITHLQEQHGSNEKPKVYNSSKVKVEIPFETRLDMYCIIAHGEVFRVGYKREVGNQTSYWAVQFVGPRLTATKYKCEIGIVDIRNTHRRLIRIEMCQELTTTNNMFNKCVLLPSNVVSWFSFDGKMSYYCKISPIKANN